jgi:hypothetical protein
MALSGIKLFSAPAICFNQFQELLFSRSKYFLLVKEAGS